MSNFFISIEQTGLLSQKDNVIKEILSEYPIVKKDNEYYLSIDELSNMGYITLLDDQIGAIEYRIFSDFNSMRTEVKDSLESNFDDECESHFPIEVIKSWAKGESSGPGYITGNNFYNWVDNVCDDESSVIEELCSGESPEMEDLFLNAVASSDLCIDGVEESLPDDHEYDENDDLQNLSFEKVIALQSEEIRNDDLFKNKVENTLIEIQNIIIKKDMELNTDKYKVNSSISTSTLRM